MGPEWALQAPFIGEAREGTDWRSDEQAGQWQFRNMGASCALLGGIEE